MRIMFINAVLGGDYSALDISITNLATYVNKRTQHSAIITDLVFHRKHWKEHISRKIRQFKPDIIGISTTSLYLQHFSLVISEIKNNFNLPIILGGYYASIHPKEALKIPGVIAVCVGDAELSLSRFLDRYENGKTLKNIHGIWFKQNDKIIRNSSGNFIKNIDQFPIPDWDLWEDLDKYLYYLGMIYFIGNRGCPYRCINCDAHQISDSVDGCYYRIRNPKKYAQEIIYQWSRYKDKGMRLAQLFDQVPTLNQKWLKNFCDEYRRNIDTRIYKYSMFSRIDSLDKDKIELLARSGCGVLRMGVESGNDFIRKEIYNKNVTKNKIKKIFSLCKKNGIAITAFYILGGPAENKNTANQTINLARKLDAERSAFFMFKPVNVECERLVKKYGGNIDYERLNKADNFTYDAVVRHKDLSIPYIEYLQKKAYFLTFGKRIFKMVNESPFTYFKRLSEYFGKGINDGLDINYMIPYFHIYGYDYISR